MLLIKERHRINSVCRALGNTLTHVILVIIGILKKGCISFITQTNHTTIMRRQIINELASIKNTRFNIDLIFCLAYNATHISFASCNLNRNNAQVVFNQARICVADNTTNGLSLTTIIKNTRRIATFHSSRLLPCYNRTHTDFILVALKNGPNINSRDDTHTIKNNVLYDTFM